MEINRFCYIIVLEWESIFVWCNIHPTICGESVQRGERGKKGIWLYKCKNKLKTYFFIAVKNCSTKYYMYVDFECEII